VGAIVLPHEHAAALVHLNDAASDQFVPAGGCDASGAAFRKVPFHTPTGMGPLSLRRVLAISIGLSAASEGSA